MKRFVEGEDRRQATLLSECLDDYVSEENPVRVIDAFAAKLDMAELGFEGVVPERTGRPAYHPATLLKIYIYGYLNRIPSSRRLEREAGRNLELMWLTGRLAPDFKTIADFRRDNGPAIRTTCRRFVLLCRDFDLPSEASVAIDSSKFKAVNARERNYTPNVVRRRMEQVEASVTRYLAALETADRQDEETARARTERLKDRLARLALDLAEPGDVLVVDAGGDLTTAIMGDLMLAQAKQRGVAGLVINGEVRDVDSIRAQDLPLYAAGVTHRGPYKDGPGEINVAVAMDGMVVEPGDLVLGDADGVLGVPFDAVPAVLAAAEAKKASEEKEMAAILAGTSDRAWVLRTLESRGCEIEE